MKPTITYIRWGNTKPYRLHLSSVVLFHSKLHSVSSQHESELDNMTTLSNSLFQLMQDKHSQLDKSMKRCLSNSNRSPLYDTLYRNDEFSHVFCFLVVDPRLLWAQWSLCLKLPTSKVQQLELKNIINISLFTLSHCKSKSNSKLFCTFSFLQVLPISYKIILKCPFMGTALALQNHAKNFFPVRTQYPEINNIGNICAISE